MTEHAQETGNGEHGVGCGQRSLATIEMPLTPKPIEMARTAMIRAALRCLQAELSSQKPHAHSAAEVEHADDELALAANALVASTNALPKDSRPVGWSLVVLAGQPAAGE